MGSIINGTFIKHILARNGVIWLLGVKIGATVSALACRKNPQRKKRKKKPSKDNFTYTRVKNPGTDRNEISPGGRAPRCSYPRKVGWWSVQPFLYGERSNFRFFYWRRPYNTPARIDTATHRALCIPFSGQITWQDDVQACEECTWMAIVQCFDIVVLMITHLAWAGTIQRQTL